MRRTSLIFFLGSLLTQFATAIPPVINSGIPTCYKLRAPQGTATLTLDVCFQNDEHDDDKIIVQYLLDDEWKGWELESSHLWVGSNSSDIPTKDDGEPLIAEFPFRHDNKTTGSAVRFSVSLSQDLGFACPDEGKLFLASLHARVKNTERDETIYLNLVNERHETGSLIDQVVAFLLACPADTYDLDLRIQQADRTHTIKSAVSTDQRHRREQGCPDEYPDPADTVLLLEQSFMERVNVTLTLATLVNRGVSGPIEETIEEQRDLWEIFDGWSDINDQTIVAKPKDSNFCYGVFSGVNGIQPLDQWQNLNPFFSEVEDSGCHARRGFYSAYYTWYYKDFKDALYKCYYTCVDGCGIVLGGHSQGGAAAVVGSIDLEHYHPEVITFGAPRVISNYTKCNAVDASRHFRFLNTISTGRKYDYSPFQINFFNEVHIGFPLFLDDVGNFPLSLPRIHFNQARFPLSIPLHEREIYVERIDAMMTRDCFPIPVAKWPAGHYCRYDDECQSEYCHLQECKVGL